MKQREKEHEEVIEPEEEPGTVLIPEGLPPERELPERGSPGRVAEPARVGSQG